MKPKLSARMRAYYYLIVFIIVILSTALVTGVLFLLDAIGVPYHLGFATMVSIFAVTAVFGALLSYFVGQRILTPMIKLSQASNEVAHGNFTVQVTDSSKLEEVQTTFRNFNAMVRELGSIATLRNDFVANVSHEFKTPLTAIEGYAALLQDASLSRKEQEEYLDKILYSTHCLSNLVGNILMLSKIENKAFAEEFRNFRLDEQIRQAVVLSEAQWSKKNLIFDASLDPVSIYGCESLLSHVWSNLLSNAIKASTDGQCIILKLLEQTECVVFTITDHGHGMTEEVRKRIFDKFYQEDTSHKAEGHGLGLSLVKRIVELSDGVIEVESEPAKGSSFRVILPK